MKAPTLMICLLAIALFSCSPKVRVDVAKNIGALDYKSEVYILNLNDEIPEAAELLGEIKVGDNGFSVNCTYEKVIEKAKVEARQIGGNILKITEHKTPSAMGSSCHRIKAQIYVGDVSSLIVEESDDVIPGADYALLNVYRYPGPGSIVKYDLYLGDEVICRVQNNCKKTIKVTKFGRNTIWAKTESKVELPINIEPGHQYYVRCGIKMGFMVGRPKLESVSSVTGKKEFESFNAKHQ